MEQEDSVMGKPRFAAHVDSTQPAIVAALRQAGATVLVLDVGEEGAPDLLVGFLGTNHLLECKARLGKLRPSQVKWHAGWHGPKVATVRSVPEALRAVGIAGPTAAARREEMGVLAKALRPARRGAQAVGKLSTSVRSYADQGLQDEILRLRTEVRELSDALHGTEAA